VVVGTVSHAQVVVVLSLDQGSRIPGVRAGLRQLALVEAAGTTLGVVLAPLVTRDPDGAWRLLPLLFVLAVLSRRQARLATERHLLDDLAHATRDLHVSLRQDEVVEALSVSAARLLPGSEATVQRTPPADAQVGVRVGDDGPWLVARSGVSQVGVPTERRVLEGLATAAERALDNAWLHRQVEEQARTDALTGLPNRLALVQRLDEELARARRQGGHVGLAFLDLDGFKRINDEKGHEAGDAVLVELARHLRKATRTEDMVARLAGDEFCVVLVGITDRSQCAAAGEELRLALERDLASTGVGVSLGIALGPDDGADPAGLLHAADLGMYADKTGRPSV